MAKKKGIFLTLFILIGIFISSGIMDYKNVLAKGDSLTSILGKKGALDNDEVYVGYGKKDITPKPEHAPIPLRGYGNSQFRTAKFTEGEQEFGSSLNATAIAIGDENNIVVLVTLDLTGTSGLIAPVREYVFSHTENQKLKQENILLSGTHTHSAPDIVFSKSAYPELTENVANYKEYLVTQIGEAILEALDDYSDSPSKVYYGKINVVNEAGINVLNFVRHYETSGTYKDGSIVYSGNNHGAYSWSSSKNKYISTPGITAHTSTADSSLQIIKFEREGKDDIMLANFQAHPTVTGGASNPVISSDFIGSFVEAVENDSDFGNVKVAYFTGAAGDLNTVTSLASEQIANLNVGGGNAEQKRQRSTNYGTTLASYTKELVNDIGLTKANVGEIKGISRKVSLPSKSIEDVNDNLLTNATYCDKIWDASWPDIKKMIEGTYEWDMDSYPVDLDNNVYGPDGKSLAKLILAYKGGILNDAIDIQGNDEDGYTATISDTITRSYLNKLISLFGANLEDRIYSVYHAGAVIRNAGISAGRNGAITMHAISIGDIAFTSTPYEMFHESGLYIKEHSPNPMTFVLELTNGASGYFPTSAAYDYGCYEADTSSYRKGSAEIVADEIVSALNYLKGNSSVITYDYNNPTLAKFNIEGEYVETGYIVDWNKDFTITGVYKPETPDKRYLIIGNYDSGDNNFHIEINKDNKFRIYLGAKATDDISEQTIGRFNEEIAYTFSWNASTKTYTFQATESTYTNISMTGTYATATGKATKPLRMGKLDYRTSTTAFNDTSYAKDLKITKIFTFGRKLENPNNVTREGYTWNGWYTAKTGGVEVTNETDVPETNQTYYGRWTPNTYGISYTLNGGMKGSKAPTSGVYDSNVIIDNPTKTITVTGNENGTGATIGTPTSGTQTFAGWTSTTLGNNALTGTSEDPTTDWTGTSTKNTYFKNLRDDTGEVTLIANWTPVAFDLPTIEKEGYICTWNTKADGSGTKRSSGENYTPKATTSNSIILYAQCIENFDVDHYESDYENEEMSSIELETTFDTYKSYFTLPTGYTLEVDLGNKDYIYTGSITKILYNNTVKYTFTNVVLGDINGDGSANSGDLLKIRQHLLNIAELKGVYFKAADINKTDTINSGDLLDMRLHLLGRKPIS